MNDYEDTSIFEVSHSSEPTSRASSSASSSETASTVVHWIRVTVNSGIVFLRNHAFRLLRRIRRYEVAEPLWGRVDHLDLTLSDASNEQVVLKPDADNRVPSHAVDDRTRYRQSLAWDVSHWAPALAEAYRVADLPAIADLRRHRHDADHCGGWEVLAWPCPTAAKVLDKLLGEDDA